MVMANYRYYLRDLPVPEADLSDRLQQNREPQQPQLGGEEELGGEGEN